METVGWVIGALVFLYALCGVYFLYVDLKHGLMPQTVGTIVNQLILVAWALFFPDLNKLHLLWLTPLTYVWGIPASLLIIKGKWTVLLVAIGLNVTLLWFLT